MHNNLEYISIMRYNKKRKYKENNKKNSTFVHSFNLYV